MTGGDIISSLNDLGLIVSDVVGLGVFFSSNACLSDWTVVSLGSSGILSDIKMKWLNKTILFKIPAVIKIDWKLYYLRSTPYDIACKKAPSPDPDFMIDNSGGSLSLAKFSLIVILTVISLIAIEKNKNC